MAGYFVSKGVDKFGFGFNFLHKEVQIFHFEILMHSQEHFINNNLVHVYMLTIILCAQVM